MCGKDFREEGGGEIRREVFSEMSCFANVYPSLCSCPIFSFFRAVNGEKEICMQNSQICSIPASDAYGCQWNVFVAALKACMNRVDIPDWRRTVYKQVLDLLPESNCIRYRYLAFPWKFTRRRNFWVNFQMTKIWDYRDVFVINCFYILLYLAQLSQWLSAVKIIDNFQIWKWM